MIISKDIKPKPHPLYGDNYVRGKDPFHPNAFKGMSADIIEQMRTYNPSPKQSEGWFLLDAWGNEIGFIPDGTEISD